MRYKITAPQKVTRKVAGVPFVDGVATVDQVADRAALAYFHRRGSYRIEPLDEPSNEAMPEPSQEPPAMPARNASTDEWRAYAKAVGMPDGQADEMGRDQLAEHYNPKGDDQ